MKDKILLIRPDNIYGLNNYPSLGLLSVATSLAANTDIVPVILNVADEDDWRRKFKVLYSRFAMVGITIMTSQCPSAYSILQFIRSIDSKIPIVAGGWHVRLFQEQMRKSDLVDCVFPWEGEQFAKTVGHDKYCDMNRLHLVRYDLDPQIEKYITSYLTDRLNPYRPKPKRWLPYESSRGCPSKCAFCANVVSGNTKYRYKNADKTSAEMIHLVRKYKLDHIKIIDDNFFVVIKRVREIAENIIKSGIKFTWDAECRADYFRDNFLDDYTIRLCKQAGLVQLTIGIESGSQDTLNLMDKNLTVEQAEYSVSQCNFHQITSRCSFIIEVPGESEGDINKTRQFIRKLRKYHYFTCGVQTFRPYPKCRLTQNLIDKGLWSEPQTFEQWSNIDYVKQFTSAQNVMPWQVKPKKSYLIASYEYMESGVNFDTHMIKGFFSKLVCKVFKALARFRNNHNLYFLPFDLFLYKSFYRYWMSKK